jgi:predicted RNA-binding Zn-ribbon protein involved in translation (DUF1610 family)
MTIEKPSHTEDEYFAREDAERLRRMHFEEQRRLKQSEKAALAALHKGRCSGCGAQLVPEQVAGIVVQHCPSCGGAFLSKQAWEAVQTHAEPHTVMGAVLNWFRAANKP